KKHIIPPVVEINTQATMERLAQLNADFQQAPTPPLISFTNGTWQTIPGQLGYEINLKESLQNLISNPPQVVVSAKFPLILKPIPAPQVDLTQVQSQAEILIQKAQGLKAYDAITNEWLDLGITSEMVANWLEVATNNEQPLIGFNEQKIADDLIKIGDQLGNSRFLDGEKLAPLIVKDIQNNKTPFLLVSHRPTTYVVQKGDTLLKISWRAGYPMWKILEANPGLDPNQLYAGQVLNIPSKDSLLPLDVIPNKRIVISISKQRLLVYENNQQIKKFIISTGVDRSPTQPGVFQVQTHKANAYASVWDLYMPNFLGIYEAWPGFMNGIHGLPMLSNGTRLWANVLGKPASYGCIILDMNDSKFLYQWADNGVVVEIQP
ncbi:MAG: L,D-transpeptidase family protein, partial [Anaerolineales bacterium]